MNLRLAKIEDLSLLKYWEAKPHVVFATGGDNDLEDPWLENQLRNPSKFVQIYIAESEGRPIGVIQVADPLNEESHYWGSVDPNLRAIDIWIGEEKDLGKGFGTEMMKLIINRCFEDKTVDGIIIDPLVSNTRAIKFYEKIGFKLVGKTYFGDDHCAVYRLDKNSVSF
jgi:aminoglycoside 6'-N-acetyltransferase